MDLLYKIGLTFIEGIGPKNVRKLVAYAGGVKEVFNIPKKKLLKIPGIGENLANKIINSQALKKAEEELKIIQQKNIKPLFYLDKEYPSNLKHYEDAPVILYQRGNFDFKNKIFVSVVGTRKPTEYGKKLCEKLIEDFVSEGIYPVIVSGLAYGIDICSHRVALENNLETIAILSFGHKYIYPRYHKNTAEKILEKGALLTEYPYNQKIEPQNFVKRNRIIAAISDVLVVVQSGIKGGSLITAEYAIEYNKPIYTFPGRVDDEKMKGCNFLIKTNRAGLIENAKDIIYEMNWEKISQKKQQQQTLFPELSQEEALVFDFLKQKNTQVNVDVISYELNLPINKILSILFNLEFKGLVKALPGRMYQVSL